MATYIKACMKCSKRQYNKVLNLGQGVYAGLTAAVATYATPVPTLTSLNTSLTALTAAITAWGVKGSRGSHTDLVNLRAAAAATFLILQQLRDYVNNTTPGDAVSLTTTGFPVTNIHTPHGILNPPRDLHNFISRKIPQGNLRLKWKRPVNSAGDTIIPNGYNVYGATTSDFSTATKINTVTKTTYQFIPGTNKYFWVAAFNTDGQGVVSDVCMAVPIVPTP